MGTNYEVRDDPTCDNPAHTKTLHIGKSSAGWKFSFHAIPDHEPPLTTWKAWQEFLEGRTVVDEYGREMTLEEFRPVVEQRGIPRDLDRPICHVNPTAQEIRVGFGGRVPSPDSRGYHDPEGYDFWEGDFS